ncbi:hypothetical protein ACFQGF_12195 [Microbulbifer taiwanensis]
MYDLENEAQAAKRVCGHSPEVAGCPRGNGEEGGEEPTRFSFSSVATCATFSFHGQKMAVLWVRIEPELHDQFVDLYVSMNMSGSAVLRQAVQAFVERYKNDQQADMLQPTEVNENG